MRIKDIWIDADDLNYKNAFKYQKDNVVEVGHVDYLPPLEERITVTFTHNDPGSLPLNEVKNRAIKELDMLNEASGANIKIINTDPHYCI